MKKIVITGVNGLLGQSLVTEFAGRFRVLATARQHYPELLPQGVEFQNLDITDAQACKEVLLAANPDIIINAAAFTHVDACETDKDTCWRVNVKGVENLASTARKNMALLVHVSTDYIFDGRHGPYSEEDKPNPLGFYGKSKLASENIIRMASIPFAIVRTNVLFGSGYRVKNNFFLWVYNSLREGKSISVVTDQFNNPTLAEDLAAGIGRLIEQSQYGVYNIAGKEYLNRYDFAVRVATAFGFPTDLIHPITTDALKQNAPRPMRGGLKIDRAVKDLKFQPRSLSEVFDFLKRKLA